MNLPDSRRGQCPRNVRTSAAQPKYDCTGALQSELNLPIVGPWGEIDTPEERAASTVAFEFAFTEFCRYGGSGILDITRGRQSRNDPTAASR